MENFAACEGAVSAIEYFLSFAIEEYSTQVIQGKVIDVINASWSTKDPNSWKQYKAPRTAGEAIPPGDIPLYRNAWISRTDLGLVNPSNVATKFYDPVDNFTVAQKSNDPLGKFFLPEFTADGGFKTTADMVGYILFDDSEVYLTSNPLVLDPIYRSPDISTTFTNIATSMTINMRNNADGLAIIAGTATITKIVVVMR